MARNDLSWQQVQPNFNSSNQMQAIAGNSLSRAGTIFDRTAQYFQQENQRLLQEKMLMDKERNDLFSNIGKQLSNEAMQYATEATVDKNGTVSHQFNSDKYNEYILNKVEENGFKNLSPQDQATIWSNLNMSDNYKVGMANNQANAENSLKRQQMMFDREQALWNRQLDKEKLMFEYAKLDSDNKSKSGNKFNDNLNYLVTDLVSSIASGTPLNKEEFKNLATNLYSTATDDFQRNKIQRLLNFTDLNSEQAKYLESIRNNENSFDKTLSYIAKELGMSLDDIKKISTVGTANIENTEYKDKDKFINDLTNGTFVNIITNNLKKKSKEFNNLNLEGDNYLGENFRKLINILGEYYYDTKKEKTAETVLNIFSQYLTKNQEFIPGKQDRNLLEFPIEDTLNALLTNDFNNKYAKKLGFSSKKEFDKLSQIAQRQLGIKFDNLKKDYNKNKNKNNISKEEKIKNEAKIRQEMLKVIGNNYQITNINNTNNKPKQINNIPQWEILNK